MMMIMMMTMINSKRFHFGSNIVVAVADFVEEVTELDDNDNDKNCVCVFLWSTGMGDKCAHQLAGIIKYL